MKSLSLALGLALSALLTGPASAHVTVFMDHTEENPLENAFRYPVEDTIEPLFAVNGFLTRPGQVDYLTFTACQGDRFVGFTINPHKHGARDFAPAFALIGPGLPASTGATPFLVPPGMGAQVFSTPKEREISEEQFGYGPLLEGPQHEVLLPETGRYYVAVYDPEGKSGHYIFSIGTSEDETLIPNVEQYTIPSFGDLNGDGQVGVEDVALILQSVVRKGTLTARQRFAADVGPVGNPDSEDPVSPGDGVVDLGDASRILRRAVGLDASQEWPF